jgi:hypothetical protein
MATNHDEYDLLKNPAVDYDRSDLSPKGIMGFLVGLLVAGIFVELVLWGMFHFLSRSPFFAKGNPSPMLSMKQPAPAKVEGIDFENAPHLNPDTFPQPRLQTDDVVDMRTLLEQEHAKLYPKEAFVDQGGTVHLPIDQAMKLIVERGLPVKPAGAVAPVAAKAVPATDNAAPQAKGMAAQ